MTIDIGKVFHAILGINWRTNGAAVASLLTALGLLVHDAAVGQWPNHDEQAAIGIALTNVWGFFVAKDKNVTGGTVSNVDGTVAKPVSMIEGGRVV